MYTDKGISYLDSFEDFVKQNDLYAIIPQNLKSKEELLNTIAEQLHFPLYFGKNWDALYDCMNDFTWTNCFRIVIVHKDLPVIGDDNLKIYLNILSESVAEWKSRNEHKLFIIFPSDKMSEVRRLLD